MANIISLTSFHTKQASFNHPLLDGAPTYTEQEVASLAAVVLGEPGFRDALVLALRSCLRNIVGRFLFYWPDTIEHKDDMVSVGFETLIKFANNPCTDDVLKSASRAIQDAIKLYLNDYRALVSASLRQQWYLATRGESPVYMEGFSGEEESIPEDSHPPDAGDETLRDVLDALAQIIPKDEIDIYLMDELNWGKGYQQLADELGIGVATVHRRKMGLYEKYIELTR